MLRILQLGTTQSSLTVQLELDGLAGGWILRQPGLLPTTIKVIGCKWIQGQSRTSLEWPLKDAMVQVGGPLRSLSASALMVKSGNG
mmetsp:Transcript_101252/g.163342  ORF Transcript_101252/g.163342 Transcript_101252/m.163342 type:complete len:86 (-) Transcript_101252:566-823(-)